MGLILKTTWILKHCLALLRVDWRSVLSHMTYSRQRVTMHNMGPESPLQFQSRVNLTSGSCEKEHRLAMNAWEI